MHVLIPNYLLVTFQPNFSRTFTFLLSAFLIPHASALHNAVGTITPSYRHFFPFIPNPLLFSTIFSASQSPHYTLHSVYVLHPFHNLHLQPLATPGNKNNPLHLMARHLVSYAIDPHFHTIEHLITLLLLTFTLNFLSHTLPNSLTSLHNFYFGSATCSVSSANNSWFISNLLPFTLHNSSPFPSTLAFASHSTPSIYTLNNHGDITQPCFNLTLTGNHSLTSIHIQTHVLLSTYKLGTAFNNVSLTPCTLSISHRPYWSIVSYTFSKSIDAQNSSFQFARYFHTLALHGKHLVYAPSTLPKPTLLLPNCTFSSSPNLFHSSLCTMGSIHKPHQSISTPHYNII